MERLQGSGRLQTLMALVEEEDQGTNVSKNNCAEVDSSSDWNTNFTNAVHPMPLESFTIHYFRHQTGLITDLKKYTQALL